MKKLATALAYAFYVLAIAEIALQAFYWAHAGQPLWRRTAVPIFAADPLTGFWNQRNLDFWHRTNEFQSHVLTNGDGLRVAAQGVEYQPGRDPSRFRVVVLGPSFAFGWGVNDEQSFARQLETSIGAARLAPGKRIEVINAGVPFMSAGQSLDWYAQRGKTYAPDLVMLLTYGSLDIADEYRLRAAHGEPRRISGAARRCTARRSARDGQEQCDGVLRLERLQPVTEPARDR